MTNEERQPAVGRRQFGVSAVPYLQDGRLTAAGLARALTHPDGGLKGAPGEARVIPFLNKVETDERLAAGREAAGLMLAEPRVSRVILGALHGAASPAREVWRRVTAMVLAAGESTRMGRNKLLLPWGDTTVIGRTIENARASNVSAVLVVTGHQRELIEQSAGSTEPSMIQNEDYAKGMLTSVQAAVRRLPNNVSAALVLLGDQPMVGPDIIDKLLLAYAAGPYGLIAPTHRGRRGNPVLIDRRYFAELLALPPDAAPRLLLQRHPDDLLTVEVETDAILHDLDRPEDYERWRPKD
jgi:molybdenum cofactor cytidylyltransferase